LRKKELKKEYHMVSDTVIAKLPVVRVFSDAEGVSQITDESIPLLEPDAARLTHITKAKSVAFRILPVGMFRDWHPTPTRQYVIIISGIVEVGTANGQIRQTGPGCVTLHEDIDGKGHTTRVVGDSPAVVAFIPIVD
jgi:hypothetical protein